MIYSMTAFSRFEKKFGWGNIVWEIRSLNQRYLDISVDIPNYLREFSWEIRKKVKSCLLRGKIECFLYIEMTDTIISREFNVDKQLVHHLIESAKWIKTCTNEGEINPLLVLSWPGVITYKKNVVANDINLVLLECFEETLYHLIQNRKREGLFLKEKILEKLNCIYEEIEKMRQCIPDILKLKREKILKQMKDICIYVDSVRLEQELLIIVQKIDISEEIDRLTSHIKEAENILSKKGPMGRRLDFISQELYREVNTIASKSISFDITQSVVSLKVLIEQIREQVQNIE